MLAYLYDSLQSRYLRYLAKEEYKLSIHFAFVISDPNSSTTTPLKKKSNSLLEIIFSINSKLRLKNSKICKNLRELQQEKEKNCNSCHQSSLNSQQSGIAQNPSKLCHINSNKVHETFTKSNFPQMPPPYISSTIIPTTTNHQSPTQSLSTKIPFNVFTNVQTSYKILKISAHNRARY